MFIQEDRKEAFWIVGYPLSRTGGGGGTEGGVSEREEETDVETETDRYRQADRQKGGVLDCRLPFVKEREEGEGQRGE